MQPVVDHRFSAGLAHPGVAGLLERLAESLHREIDDRGRPAEGRGSRPGLEVIGGERAPERQLHVRMHVDPTGDHVFTCRIDPLCPGGLQALPDHRDLLAVDEHVAFVGIGRGDDGAVGDERLPHVTLPLRGARGC